MGPKINSVTDPNDGVPQDAGTPAQVEVPQGTPTEGQVDANQSAPAESVETYKEKLAQAEIDRRRMQSALQKSQADAERRYQEEVSKLRAQMDELSKKGLTEQERIAYEQQKLKEERDQLAQQLQEFQQQRERETLAQGWIEFFRDAGIDTQDLDTSDMEKLTTDGLNRMKEELQRLKNGGAQRQTQPQGNRPPAQQAYAGSGGVPAATTWADLRSSMSKQLGHEVSDDELYTLAERGNIDLNKLLKLS